MVLEPADIEQFIELGHCTLRHAFERRDAARACDLVWQRMHEQAGIVRDDPQTWPAVHDIEEHLDAPEILRCFTDRLASAIEQLHGPGRWIGDRRWGLWPANFRWLAEAAPHVPDHGWHIDGNWFRHTIDCPKQGLLLIGLFTDLGPGAGGTLLAERSHRRTARVLAAHPGGLSHLELFERVLAEPLGNIHQVTGEAGDVVLAHPFLFHNRGPNRARIPRIMSNTEAPLREPMRLDRPRNELSAVELAIVHALAEPDPAPRDPIHCRF
jgi:hypothetical protein